MFLNDDGKVKPIEVGNLRPKSIRGEKLLKGSENFTVQVHKEEEEFRKGKSWKDNYYLRTRNWW